MTAREIDRIILSVVNTRWQKVAMVLAKLWKRLELHDEGKLRLVERRIQKLVDDGRLVAQGDLSQPRCSEIKFP
jgi:hypothetical protein